MVCAATLRAGADFHAGLLTAPRRRAFHDVEKEWGVLTG